MSMEEIREGRKCLPRTAAAGSSGADSSTQQEIISYSNAGGRQFQPADRQRQHASSKPLRSADVAIRRTEPASGGTSVGGYGTLFYVHAYAAAGTRCE